MACKCKSPKSVPVKSYMRTGARRKKAPAVYWECESHGRGCGTKHTSEALSLKHSARLDRAERRRGRRASWHPVKHQR